MVLMFGIAQESKRRDGRWSIPFTFARLFQLQLVVLLCRERDQVQRKGFARPTNFISTIEIPVASPSE